MLQPEILEKEQALIPILRLAFRPFFLLPTLLSIIAVLIWIIVLKGNISWQGVLPAKVWHGHEMIFGFAASVAVGFLLSAAQTWTGVRSINGWKLAVTVFFGYPPELPWHLHPHRFWFMVSFARGCGG